MTTQEHHIYMKNTPTYMEKTIEQSPKKIHLFAHRYDFQCLLGFYKLLFLMHFYTMLILKFYIEN